MNTIVTIVPFVSYPHVEYYTIQVDGKDSDEATDFMDKYEHNERFVDEFDEIFIFIDEWGKNGIPHRHRRLLRPEKGANALPPKHIRRGSNGENMLRMYCYLINDNIMILGNGGHKTKPSDKHQDSPYLKPHFDFFNRVADAIDKAIISGSLREKDGKLEGDLEIWLK